MGPVPHGYRHPLPDGMGTELFPAPRRRRGHRWWWDGRDATQRELLCAGWGRDGQRASSAPVVAEWAGMRPAMDRTIKHSVVSLLAADAIGVAMRPDSIRPAVSARV